MKEGDKGANLTEVEEEARGEEETERWPGKGQLQIGSWGAASMEML